MKYILCMYDLEGKLLATRRWACLGCGARHMSKVAPCCMRQATQEGKIVRQNALYVKIAKKVK